MALKNDCQPLEKALDFTIIDRFQTHGDVPHLGVGGGLFKTHLNIIFSFPYKHL